MSGMLRIRYTDRKSVFEHRDQRREDADELIVAHLQRFGRETIFVNNAPVKREVDPRTVIAEWVENEGTDKETVTRIPVPGVESDGPVIATASLDDSAKPVDAKDRKRPR